MNRMADLIEQNAERLGLLETLAMGQPISHSKMGVFFSAGWWRYYAGWADKLTGQVLPDQGEGVYRIVQYEPLGVCAGLAAWNATIMFAAWKVAPAVAAGNTFIFKASEKSPLGALALGELVKQAGFPPGVINFVSGDGATGALLAAHMKIDKITFTGSTSIGRRVQRAATDSNMKKCTLELGGKSPALVFDDADTETALTHMSSSFMINTTQVCAATTRLLIQQDIAESFIAKLRQRFDDMTPSLYSNPRDPKSTIGPLADRQQYERVVRFLKDARQQDLNFVSGGRVEATRPGLFVEPTMILNPPTESCIYRDEIFGPVLSVKTFSTEEEAIVMANDTIFGLGAAIFTRNIARALRVARQLSSGSVGVNQPIFPSPAIPFGGIKESGYGREGGQAGIMAYMEAKTISINMNSN